MDEDMLDQMCELTNEKKGKHYCLRNVKIPLSSCEQWLILEK